MTMTGEEQGAVEMRGTYRKDTVTGMIGRVTGAWVSETRGPQVLLEGADATGRPIAQWFDIERTEPTTKPE